MRLNERVRPGGHERDAEMPSTADRAFILLIALGLDGCWAQLLSIRGGLEHGINT